MTGPELGTEGHGRWNKGEFGATLVLRRILRFGAHAEVEGDVRRAAVTVTRTFLDFRGTLTRGVRAQVRLRTTPSNYPSSI